MKGAREGGLKLLLISRRVVYHLLKYQYNKVEYDIFKFIQIDFLSNIIFKAHTPNPDWTSGVPCSWYNIVTYVLCYLLLLPLFNDFELTKLAISSPKENNPICCPKVMSILLNITMFQQVFLSLHCFPTASPLGMETYLNAVSIGGP